MSTAHGTDHDDHQAHGGHGAGHGAPAVRPAWKFLDIENPGEQGFMDRIYLVEVFRGLWITRINAACRQHDMSYSQFVAGLKAAEIEVDRKILADLAVRDSAAFGALVTAAREALDAA